MLLLLALFFVLPLMRLLWVALSEPAVGLTNFYAFFDSQAALRALATTLRVSGIVTLVCMVVGMFIAWEMRSTRSPVARVILWASILFPLLTSVVVRNYAFTILLQRRGLVNRTLMDLGLIDAPLNLLYTDFAIVVGMTYTMLPFAVLPLYAAFVSISDELLNAAESLGSSRLGAIRDVVLPLTLPSILAAAAIVFVISVGFYVTPIVLGGPESPFIATRIDQQINVLFDLPGGAATSAILVVAAMVIIAFAWRLVGFERLQRALA